MALEDEVWGVTKVSLLGLKEGGRGQSQLWPRLLLWGQRSNLTPRIYLNEGVQGSYEEMLSLDQHAKQMLTLMPKTLIKEHLAYRLIEDTAAKEMKRPTRSPSICLQLRQAATMKQLSLFQLLLDKLWQEGWGEVACSLELIPRKHLSICDRE